MRTPPPTLPTDTINVRPWPDPVIDNLGHDPRSAYVEQYWLGILGPSATWLLRRLVAGLEQQPAGYVLELADVAVQIGLGHNGGRNSPFARTLARLVQFDAAQQHGLDGIAVRRKLPPLNRRQIERLPDSLRRAHDRWQQEQLDIPAVEHQRRRGRQLALSLLELGEDFEGAERQLLRWRFHPAMARESVNWAVEHHRRATQGEASEPSGAA